MPGTRRCAIWCARLDAVHALRRKRQQLSGFLLRQGFHYRRPAWTKLHRRWLAWLRFEQAAHHIVLEDYIAAVEAAEARRDRLTAQIEASRTGRWPRSWRHCRRCAAWRWSMRRRRLPNWVTSRALPIRAS
jgi:hypothetical protein